MVHTETLDPRVFQAVRGRVGSGRCFSPAVVSTPDRGKARAQAASDDRERDHVWELPWPRAKVVRDAHAKDKTRAQHVARRAIRARTRTWSRWSTRFQGYEQNGTCSRPIPWPM